MVASFLLSPFLSPTRCHHLLFLFVTFTFHPSVHPRCKQIAYCAISPIMMNFVEVIHCFWQHLLEVPSIHPSQVYLLPVTFITYPPKVAPVFSFHLLLRTSVMSIAYSLSQSVLPLQLQWDLLWVSDNGQRHVIKSQLYVSYLSLSSFLLASSRPI